MKRLFSILLIALSVCSNAHPTKTCMENQKPYTILVLLNATPQWLSLTREQRSTFFEEELTPIFLKVKSTTNVRMFDSEYFHSSVSDFIMINTTSLDDYKLLIECLRDTKIYSAPYFQIKDIIVGQENLFEEFNQLFKE